MKKPLYKKWWVWLIALLVIAALSNFVSGGNKDSADKNDSDTDNVKEVAKEEDTEKQEPKEPEEKKIEVDKEIELDKINIKLENVYVKDNELKFGFWWNHWATNDKAHFSVFAYPVITQNGEELELQDDKDTLLKQTEKGVDSRVDLKVELQDDSPVEIKFKTTSDNPEEEVINIELN